MDDVALIIRNWPYLPSEPQKNGGRARRDDGEKIRCCRGREMQKKNSNKTLPDVKLCFEKAASRPTNNNHKLNVRSIKSCLIWTRGISPIRGKQALEYSVKKLWNAAAEKNDMLFYKRASCFCTIKTVSKIIIN